MKLYKAYLKQAGEGCDYTIGCGYTSFAIEAEDMDAAIIELIKIIKEEYSHYEARLDCVELCEISKIYNGLDLNSLYKEIDNG